MKRLSMALLIVVLLATASCVVAPYPDYYPYGGNYYYYGRPYGGYYYYYGRPYYYHHYYPYRY